MCWGVKAVPFHVHTRTQEGQQGTSSTSAAPGASEQSRPRAVLVRSPVLRGVGVSDVSKLGPEDRRFVGSFYIKVCCCVWERFVVVLVSKHSLSLSLSDCASSAIEFSTTLCYAHR